MKVPSSTDATKNSTNELNKTAPKRSTENQPGSQEETAAGSVGRDFASVLEDVTRGERAGKKVDEGPTRERSEEAKATGQTERERETERREDGSKDTGAGGGFDQRGAPVREAGPIGEATNARAILHIADLERIVAAVRTQINSAGHREVTIEMQRSVLEGLRVKLSTDEQGRITAEFIAASEKVKAQLDSRSAELADLLRSRGIDLAALRTTVGADASGQNNAGARQQQDSLPLAANAQTATATQADAQQDNLDSNSSTTYRA